MNSLSTASLAIYVILSLPVLYILAKHWRHGFLGWLFLFFFCTLRLVGGALSMDNDSPTGSLLSSVGLSPLLLATSGILHEARLYRLPHLDKKMEWVYVLFFHMLVVAGIVLVAMGASNLQNQNPRPNDETIIQAGVSILTASWVILIIWAGATLLSNSRQGTSAVAHREGSVLLNTVCFALIFVGIRVLYSLVAFITEKAYLNPVSGALTVRVLLGFLPELIATLAFVGAGIRTRNVPPTLNYSYQDGDFDSRKQFQQSERGMAL